MTGVVLKSHHVITSSLAKLLQDEVTPELLVGGGISLNNAIGGFNPEAVAASFALGGRFVWFPTLDAANDRRARGEPGGLCVTDEEGELRPAVLRILDLVATYDGVLCTGHLSVTESLHLIEAAQRAGIKHIVVTHPEHERVAMGVTTQKRLAAQGVLLERAFPRQGIVTDLPGLAQRIRAVGVGSSVIGTDLGRADLPDAVTGLYELLSGLHREGFSRAELRTMSHTLPLNLLQPKGHHV